MAAAPSPALLSDTERDQLILDHLKKTHLVARMSHGPHYLRNELRNVAELALTEAAEKFDKNQGVKFFTFAVRKIRGALRDFLRTYDYMPRTERIVFKKLIAQLKGNLNATLLYRAIDDALPFKGKSVTERRIFLKQAAARLLKYGTDNAIVSAGLPSKLRETKTLLDSAGAKEKSPDAALMEIETAERLRTAIAALPERQRTVICRYLFDDAKDVQIASELGVCSSRSCKIRKQALRNLRNHLADLSPSRPMKARVTAPACVS